MTQRHFFSTLHRLFLVIFATATVVAFVLLRNSRFNFHCYTQCEATPAQKSARKWRCDLSRHLARKITKGIHSCKPASLNRPIMMTHAYTEYCTFFALDGLYSPFSHTVVPSSSSEIISAWKEPPDLSDFWNNTKLSPRWKDPSSVQHPRSWGRLSSMLSEDVQAGKTTTPSSWRRGGEDSFDSKTEVQTFLRRKKKKRKNVC